MPNLIFLIFTYIIEAVIFFFYCESIYKTKKSRFVSFTITIIAYLSIMAIYKFVVNQEIANALFIIVANIIITNLAFQSSFKSSLFHSFIMFILRYVSEFIATYLLALTYHLSTKEIVKYYFEICVLMSSILYFVFSRVITKISTKETNAKSWGKWAILSVLPISSIIIILVFRMFTTNTTLTFKQNIVCIFSIALLSIVNIIVYMVYEQAEKSNQKVIELELVNQKNDIDIQYLELLEKKNETMNIMVHDYKNNILTISSMTDSKEIREYINNMLGEISKYNQIAKTKNRLLDVILSKYTDLCNNKNINFETDIMTDNLCFINSYDISSLFNNILDNAVEAASISCQKYIHLEITNSLNSYHKIIVSNSCDLEPKTNKGKLITSKKNKDAHGFGTKSIKKVVSKYGGEMKWEYNSVINQFKLIILFPNDN